MWLWPAHNLPDHESSCFCALVASFTQLCQSVIMLRHIIKKLYAFLDVGHVENYSFPIDLGSTFCGFNFRCTILMKSCYCIFHKQLIIVN